MRTCDMRPVCVVFAEPKPPDEPAPTYANAPLTNVSGAFADS